MNSHRDFCLLFGAFKKALGAAHKDDHAARRCAARDDRHRGSDRSTVAPQLSGLRKERHDLKLQRSSSN
jgi:hypothetical protein